MTRVEFLTELDHRLSSLSKAEADEHLAYYAEMLADRMEDGMSEEEAVASMESLDTIAARILGTAYTKPRKKNSDLGHTILCLGLIGFLVAILIGLLVGVSTVTYETIEPDYSDVIIFEEQVPIDEVILMSINVSEIRSIEVSWGSGDVILEAWDDSHIGIMDDWNEAQYVNEGGDIRIECTSGGSGDLIVYLPYDLADRMVKSIRVDTNSGGIMVNYLNARELVVSTNSGSIDVSGCFNDVSIESNSGAIAFWGDAQTMTVETVSGEVILRCGDMLEKLEADVNSGDITLLLPSWLGFSLEFDSVSGEMYSSTYDLYSNERFVFDDGAAALRIESVSGWLYLEQE